MSIAHHVPRWYAAWSATAIVAFLTMLALRSCSVMLAAPTRVEQFIARSIAALEARDAPR